MNEIKSYRDLIVWQKAMEFVRLVYVLSRDFPRDEQFGLTSQLRRSAFPFLLISPKGMAEAPRRTTFAFSSSHGDHYLKPKRKSKSPKCSALPILRPTLNFPPLSTEIEKMLNALIRNLNR